MLDKLKNAVRAYNETSFEPKDLKSFRPDPKLKAFFKVMLNRQVNKKKKETDIARTKQGDWERLGGGMIKEVQFQEGPSSITGCYLRVLNNSTQQPPDPQEYEQLYHQLVKAGIPTFKTLDPDIPPVVGPDNPYKMDTDGQLFVFDQRLLRKDPILFSFGGDLDREQLDKFVQNTSKIKKEILDSVQKQLDNICDLASQNGIEILGQDCFNLIYDCESQQVSIEIWDYDTLLLLGKNYAQENHDNSFKLNKGNATDFYLRLSEAFDKNN